MPPLGAVTVSTAEPGPTTRSGLRATSGPTTRSGPDNTSDPTEADPVGDGTRRLTQSALGVVGTWTWFLYGFGAALPLLRDELGTSRTVMGLHSTALAVGGLTAGLAATTLVRRFRRRGVTLLGIALVSLGCTGLVGTGLLGARTPLLTLAITLVIGVGGSMTINTMTPALVEQHGERGTASLSAVNGAGAGIGFLAPLAVGAGTGLGLTWRPALLVTVPLAVLTATLVRRTPRLDALDAPLPRHGPGGKTAMARSFRPSVAVVVVCVGVEFCMSTWSADLMHQHAGLSSGAASASVSAIVAGMATGRWAVGRLSLRIDPGRLLLAEIGVAALGWALTWAATAPVPAVCGLVLAGIGIGGHYPLGVSLLLRSTPGQQDRASGTLSVAVSFAVGSAPFVVGALADAAGTHRAFLVVPALLVVAAGFAVVAARRRAELAPSAG